MLGGGNNDNPAASTFADKASYVQYDELKFQIEQLTKENRKEMKDAILHPNVFYSNSGTSGGVNAEGIDGGYDWCVEGSGQEYFWNSIDSYVSTIKTIYDPSPIGFTVPLSSVWNGFAVNGAVGNEAPNNGKDGWIAGQYFNSWFTSTQDFSKTQGWMFYRNRMVDGKLDPSKGETYYPACGFRSTLYNKKYEPAKGKVSSVGAIGYYWSNAAANNPGNHTSYCFHFYHYGVIPTTTHSRSNGCAVRPVREQ